MMDLCGYQSIEQSVHGFPDPGHGWNGCVDDPLNVQWKRVPGIGGNEPIQIDPEEEPGGDVNVMWQTSPRQRVGCVYIVGHGAGS